MSKPECFMDEHEWEPVAMAISDATLQPFPIDKAKVFMICRKCNRWTYDVFEWIGYYLGGDVDETAR